MEHSSDNSNIYINVENTSVFVKIQIKDEGEGISKKDINHIFERFYKSKIVLKIVLVLTFARKNNNRKSKRIYQS